MRKRSALWILSLIFSAASFSAAIADDDATRPIGARWRADLQPWAVEGAFHRAKRAELTVLNQGYYDETADGLELSIDGVAFPLVRVARSFALECHQWLGLAETVLAEDALPWARAGDRVRFSLRDEVFSTCWDLPVNPWTLKLEVRSADGESVTRVEFRGQPYRLPR